MGIKDLTAKEIDTLMKISSSDSDVTVYKVYDPNQDTSEYFQDLDSALEFAERVDSKVFKMKVSPHTAERLFR